MDYKSDKPCRLLRMNEQLAHGGVLRKDALVSDFGITSKTAQRDIESLRLYLSETSQGDLRYDRKNDCYRLERVNGGGLGEAEVFAVCKILIESRAFNKAEFEELLNKLLAPLSQEQRKPVETRIGNERVNYLPLNHGKPLINTLWTLANLVTEQRLTRIWYVRQDKTPKDHVVKPVGIMFSEFYFYLIAWMANDSKDFYTVFRVDRIMDIEEKNDRFAVPYADKFNEAEFRKRVQFMYTGKLKRVKFIYRGSSVEAVLDKLPTAQVIQRNDDGTFTMSAESYGGGIDMWLKSQGTWVEILEL
ncbi:MAG: WYL domain-containing protein [Clostridiales bacterium]|nr:WYL domain-containing protein [Clostridiales bacterium]MDR2751335.1 WYL domain-containing protein [Clostridiales bacterium]